MCSLMVTCSGTLYENKDFLPYPGCLNKGFPFPFGEKAYNDPSHYVEGPNVLIE